MLTKLKAHFKRDKDKTNLYHPNFYEFIEKAENDERGLNLKVNGVQYYRFKKEISMPWGRYMYLQTFLSEAALRMSTDLLKKYMENLTKILNGNKGVIELGKAFQIIGQIQSRCELAFETETTYRLASVLYFDDTEDLYSYDKAYNDLKIQSWKEAKTLDFFYMMPMTVYLNLSDLSPQDLQTFIERSGEILKGLIPETPEQ